MRTARAALAVAALVLLAGAPAASARARAEVATAPAAKFTLLRMTAPRSVRAGSTLVVRGRVANTRGHLAGSGRLTFSLRQSRPVKRTRRLRAKGTRADRNKGQNILLTKGGRGRRFAVRLVIPRRLPARVYVLRGCVRRGSGVDRASCRSRRLRVLRRRTTRRPGTTPATGGAGTGSGGAGGGSTPAALQSLRAPLTGENFYFVMADRFENGTTANDRGGLPDDRLKSGYDPTHKGFYHGGDLRGMRQRLDYIKGLGTTALWLTPSFKNKPVQGPPGQETAGYHGYWITDFTQIDPHLGTNADLADLVQAAHQRGIKVFFDIITNHTADVIGYDQKDGGPAPYGYVAKDDVPYRTASGRPFDDRDYAGTNGFPPLDPATSFPFVPHNPPDASDPSSVDHKVPEWLNDVTLYHNRGDTTFTGENALYGDFFGLDDLFTENPRVVAGMTDVYKRWIRDFKIDGFRIDTMKHVNDEFWQRFAPSILDYAHQQGKREFLMFGEVFDTTKTFTSHFTTHDDVQAVLDFPFQAAAQRFAASSGPTSALRDFFAGDDWYTDADSNVYQLPTFLGNHDMGRIGFFLRGANPGASDEEIYDRDRLAHELMYFSRGNPVVYYGDEQGFVGDGGDQDARQDMFPSRVASYNDDDLIANGATTAQSNFDPSTRLYRAIAQLAAVTRANPALRNGPQQTRYSTDGPGVFATSRYDRGSRREYVVALNNSEQPQTALVPTSAGRAARFDKVYGGGAPAAATDAGRRLAVTVPALSTVVYRSAAGIPLSGAAPDIAVQPLPEGGEARDRAEVRAFVDGSSFYDVTFEAKVGDGPWTVIGTDDNDPYRVFHEVAGLAPGTTVQYRATVLDNAGHTRTSDPASLTVAAPSIRMTAPGDRVRDRAPLAAEATPDDNDNSVRFERRVDGGDWTTVATDSSQPVYSASDDVSGLAPGTAIDYRAVLTYAPGRSVTSAVRSTRVATPVDHAVIHYNRPAGDYDNWGLHLWGDGLAPGAATAEWTSPKPFEGRDAYGAFHTIAIADDTKPVGFIVHGRPPGGNPDTKDTPNDRFFTPVDHPEIWLKEGDATIYTEEPAH